MSTTEKKNSNLQRARRAKNDEFYTRIEDVEAELWHYRDHFRGKTVYLNCDDPRWSAFWRYFCLRFGELGLERLIATHYTGVTDPGQPSFKIEAVRGRDDTAGDGVPYVDPETGGVQTALSGDGDFRSDECVELLEQADVVVTNPMFSLFREYVTQLVEYDKKFVILGNNNAVTYKEIWPLIHGGQLWLGTIANKTMSFGVPDDYYAPENAVVDEFGRRVVKVPAISWFTNLDHAKRHEKLPLWKRYTPEEYPCYDNYDAINVNKVKDIPMDYTETLSLTSDEVETKRSQGFVVVPASQPASQRFTILNPAIGVPITFLDKWNPKQFEILGYSRNQHCPEALKIHVGLDFSQPYVHGKAKYDRILIRQIVSG